MDSEKRVLIIDDEHAIADTLVAVFLSEGYAARAAYSAEEALPLIAEWNPQLAIIDVYMPGMNGIDLALILKAQHPGCGFLLFSGALQTSELIEAARQAGHTFEVLAKPVPPPELLGRVGQFFPPELGLSAAIPETV